MTRFALEAAAFQVSEAAHSQQARRLLDRERIDLVLMDWMLPGRSGLEFTRELKRQPTTRSIPVIMLTAHADEPHKVEGLEGGADDYITKPFSPRELVARIHAVLRRTRGTKEETVIVEGGLRIDQASHQAFMDDHPIELSPVEYRLLLFFMTHPERAYSRARILDHVWGEHAHVEERTVDVHIRRLRKQLAGARYDRHIQTVRGVGYRFIRSAP